MKKPTVTMALVLFTVTCVDLTAQSVTEPDTKAISLVRAAFSLTNTAHPRTAWIHAEGELSWNNQGLNPGQSTRTRRLSADWKVDFTNHRLLQRSANYLAGDLMWCDQRVTSRETKYDLFCHSNVFANYAPEKNDASWVVRMDTTYPDPQWHLAHALEHSQSLHWEGETVFAGEREDVISYADEFKNNHRLFLNSRTHFLREVSTEPQLTRFGDGFVPRIIFENYGKHGQFWSPAKVTIVQNSWTIMTSDLQSIRRNFDVPLSAADFAPPAGAVEVDQKSFDFHVYQVAPSVYFVENASPDYNSMFAVFTDYVLVVEAPASDSASTKVMAAIHETAPGKPIRYIVPTHFHEDHIGGLRAYLREGATVVTTPGNVRFMEMFMKRLRATSPQVKLPPVEVISGKRRFSDGSVTLDLLNVPSAHADEMVVAFIPSDGIAYVADGFTRDWGPWRRPTAEERTLLGQFKQLGLNIRTVLPGHGPAASQTELERYLSLIGEPARPMPKRAAAHPK